jgi:hypothetical protein
MSEAKPWEDESLKGEYYKEKAKMRRPPVAKKKPAAPGAIDAWGQAGQFAKRNRKIDKLTEPLRKSVPGQD